MATDIIELAELNGQTLLASHVGKNVLKELQNYVSDFSPRELESVLYCFNGKFLTKEQISGKTGMEEDRIVSYLFNLEWHDVLNKKVWPDGTTVWYRGEV